MHTHYSINQAAITSIMAAIGTAVAALVPSWATDDKIIIAAIGTIITALIPIINASHTKSAATEKAATISAQSPTPVLHLVPAPAPAPATPTQLTPDEITKIARDEVVRVIKTASEASPT